MRLTTPLAAILLLAACAIRPMTVDASAAPASFVVVRHAEKAAAGGDDPSLTDAGRARAAALATALADEPIVAVYSTKYARTRETAGPPAAAHGLAVSTYDAREPAASFAERLRTTHATGTVLIVGHSNTAPAIAAALCGCAVAPMDESEYDRLLVVTLHPDGAATLAVRRQPAPPGN